MKNRTDKETLLVNKICRDIAGFQHDGYIPVVVLKGASHPKLRGKSYYFTTPSGNIVHHPNAYGWRTLYHASTRQIEVGEEVYAAIRTLVSVKDLVDPVGFMKACHL